MKAGVPLRDGKIASLERCGAGERRARDRLSTASYAHFSGLRWPCGAAVACAAVAARQASRSAAARIASVMTRV